MTKKLVKALELEIESPEGLGYNVLQNNGRIAHQEVDHVHFHVIPKYDNESGLGVEWPAQETDFEKLGKLHKELISKIESGNY